MFNSSEINYPLSTPFELYHFPESVNDTSVRIAGFYDAKLLIAPKGGMKALLGVEEISLKEGDLLVVCPDTDFSLVSEQKEGVSGIGMVRMDPNLIRLVPYTAGFKTILEEARKQHMPMRIPAAEVRKWDSTGLEEICYRENQDKAFGWETMTMTRLTQICMELTRFWRENGMAVPVQDEDEDPISSITAYIHRHVQDGIRVEELAAHCNLSYPWFAKRFRDLYGVSCKEYIERIRVVRVEQYLRYTDWDLTVISEVTGYADCSHMIKNFKRLMNTTPGQYRINQKA